jgi:hypothetical protein
MQWVYMTLVVGGQERTYTYAVSSELSGQPLQDFVDSQEDRYKLSVLKSIYPDAPESVKGNIADFEQWVIDETPTPLAWEACKHPDIFPASGIEASTLLADVKDLVNSLAYDQIDTHIETVFSDHTVAQQNSLKKLYKAVLYLSKKR